jgi:hypothetical protein
VDCAIAGVVVATMDSKVSGKATIAIAPAWRPISHHAAASSCPDMRIDLLDSDLLGKILEKSEIAFMTRSPYFFYLGRYFN